MKLTFDNTTLDLTPIGKAYRVTLGEQTVEAELLHAENGRLELLIDGKRVSACVSSDGTKRWVTVNGQTSMLTKTSGAKRKSSGHDQGAGLVAPMPGLVRSVNVVEGEAVVQGQTLLVVEAMKMEIRIQAKAGGVVKKLLVQPGQTVERDQPLVEVE